MGWGNDAPSQRGKQVKQKVMICPICGGKRIYPVSEKSYWCRDCKQDIIPLVTPQDLQEVRNG